MNNNLEQTKNIIGAEPRAIRHPFVQTGAALPTVSANGVSGSVLPVNIFASQAAPVSPSGAAPKLPEGWHSTEKYGDVFVSSGGIAWVVQLVGDKFENIAVKITHEDITAKPSAERMKHAAAEKRRYNLAKTSRTPSNFAVSAAAVANGGVLEVS
jgi:hypothetical protein